MKKLLILIFIAIHISQYSYSQYGDWGFQPATIMKNNSDTFNCFVPIASAFGDDLQVRLTKEGETYYYPIDSIKYLYTDFNIYETVKYQDDTLEKHKLMCLEIEGELTLYLEVELATVGSTHKDQYLTTTTYPEPKKTYVIKKNNVTYLIREKKRFLETITPLIADRPKLLELLEHKKFKYDHLEDLIKEYNKRGKQSN